MNKFTVYTTKEVAKLLKININLVYRLIAEGKLKSIGVGRAYRITRENLEAFLRNEQQ